MLRATDSSDVEVNDLAAPMSHDDEAEEQTKGHGRNHEEIDGGQTMIVNFNEFSDSSVDFFALLAAPLDGRKVRR